MRPGSARARELEPPEIQDGAPAHDRSAGADGPNRRNDIQDRVFLPFFTTRQRGTGLGLAVVRREVEHIGGRISLESPTRNGRGTRFLMHLPIRAEAQPSERCFKPHRTPADPACDKHEIQDPGCR
ncbi:MAG: hypothetical protein HXY20_06045 [Acidobacteria bacterium]|nr:hypothetical protein [Acidobacteriota bacterium]